MKLKGSETDPNFCLDKKFDESCELVIKQLFNYGAVSNQSIFAEFRDEFVFNKEILHERRLIHPFILPAERVFVGPFAKHPATAENFPMAEEAGMEKTLYLVLQDRFL